MPGLPHAPLYKYGNGPDMYGNGPDMYGSGPDMYGAGADADVQHHHHHRQHDYHHRGGGYFSPESSYLYDGTRQLDPAAGRTAAIGLGPVVLPAAPPSRRPEGALCGGGPEGAL